MEPQIIIVTLVIALLAGGIGYLLGYIFQHKRNNKLAQENAELKSSQQYFRDTAEQNAVNAEKLQKQLGETFAALSGQALKHNSDEFLKLAQENLKQFHLTAQHELDKKEKSFESIVKPIKEALDKTEKQFKDRHLRFGQPSGGKSGYSRTGTGS